MFSQIRTCSSVCHGFTNTNPFHTGGGLFGFDISSMSAIISTQPYLCQFDEQGINPDNGLCQGPTPNTQGGITAAMPGGSWLGALLSGYLSDMLGRKTSIQIGSVIWSVAE